MAAGDELLLRLQFRSSISRHYYAMYHAARAVTFGTIAGDDHERHSVLPRNLPATFDDPPRREAELTSARLLRNLADYDPYPTNHPEWEPDARHLASTASDFLQACDSLAKTNGLI
jgi:uncharacterized protein (UPF0332 family)